MNKFLNYAVEEMTSNPIMYLSSAIPGLKNIYIYFFFLPGMICIYIYICVCVCVCMYVCVVKGFAVLTNYCPSYSLGL